MLDQQKIIHGTLYTPSTNNLSNLLLRALFENLDVDGIHTEEAPYVHVFKLTVSPQTTYGLRLARIVDFLGRGEKRRKEDGVVGGGEVRAARALVHHVQQKHALLAVVLELLEILALHGRRALDLQERDLVRLQRLRDFGGKIRELDEDEDTLILRNLVPVIWKSAITLVDAARQPT